uniref:Uncharacterized protein n=1 Tax=Clytia hemisphaerica TaxID=252671 RepID=A0A7M5XNF8_9CNID
INSEIFFSFCLQNFSFKVFLVPEISRFFFCLIFIFYSVKSLNFFFFSSDVSKILEEKKFAKFGEIFRQNPNIVNSLRDGRHDWTLLMEAVIGDRFAVFVHLMKYPQDFSLVDNEGHNVLHWVGWIGKVRHLEMFDQQTIKMLIDGRSERNSTPLHHAVSWNNHDVISWLLAKGADHELKNKDGQRPDEHPRCDGVTKEIFRSFRSS